MLRRRRRPNVARPQGLGRWLVMSLAMGAVLAALVILLAGPASTCNLVVECGHGEACLAVRQVGPCPVTRAILLRAGGAGASAAVVIALVGLALHRGGRR